ncbi:hypothetical protein FB451DRAFT_1364250, partial [Mycena latifolia]
MDLLIQSSTSSAQETTPRTDSVFLKVLSKSGSALERFARTAVPPPGIFSFWRGRGGRGVRQLKTNRLASLARRRLPLGPAPAAKIPKLCLEAWQSWYAFVNGELGRMIGNGDLYLVTGVTKCTSGASRRSKNQSGDGKVSLTLKAAQVGNAGASCTWEWESASSSVNSGPRRFGENHGGPPDRSPAAFSLVPIPPPPLLCTPRPHTASVPLTTALGRPKSSSSASTEERRTNRGDGDYVSAPRTPSSSSAASAARTGALPLCTLGLVPSPSPRPHRSAPARHPLTHLLCWSTSREEGAPRRPQAGSSPRSGSALSPAERAHWEALAREKKREHEARHPGTTHLHPPCLLPVQVGVGAAGKAKSSAPQEGQASAQVTQSRPLSEQQSLEADSLFRGPLHTRVSSDDETIAQLQSQRISPV